MMTTFTPKIYHVSQATQSHDIVQDNRAPAGSSVTSQSAESHLCIPNVNFGAGEPNIAMGSVAAGAAGKSVTFRIGSATGDVIGTLSVAPTSADDVFVEQYAALTVPHGIHDLYVTFSDAGVSLAWVIFSADSAQETPAQTDARMAWWRDARFGAFIHWGPYSVLARGEWVMYVERWDKLAYEQAASAQWRPSHYDVDAWVRDFKKAGQKYVVITAKHHDGFALYDTHVRGFASLGEPKSHYDLVHFAGYAGDPLQDLATACKRHGLQFCLYYSILDWHHPSQEMMFDNDGLSRMLPGWKDRYVSQMKAQLCELIERYDPAVLWFDGDWGEGDWWWNGDDGAKLYRYLRTLKPDLVINERVKRDSGLGDFRSPEQYIPANGLPYDWETCMTINDNWGVHATDDNWKSAETLLHNLIDIVSKGGNFLLNVGPTADGLIPPASSERLHTLGEWMDVYGDTIYGTTASPFAETPTWGRFARKGYKLFAYVFDWPTDGRLVLPALDGVHRAYLQNAPSTSLNLTQDDQSLVVELPAMPPNRYASVIVLEPSALHIDN